MSQSLWLENINSPDAILFPQLLPDEGRFRAQVLIDLLPLKGSDDPSAPGGELLRGSTGHSRMAGSAPASLALTLYLALNALNDQLLGANPDGNQLVHG